MRIVATYSKYKGVLNSYYLANFIDENKPKTQSFGLINWSESILIRLDSSLILPRFNISDERNLKYFKRFDLCLFFIFYLIQQKEENNHNRKNISILKVNKKFFLIIYSLWKTSISSNWKLNVPAKNVSASFVCEFVFNKLPFNLIRPKQKPKQHFFIKKTMKNQFLSFLRKKCIKNLMESIKFNNKIIKR
jgi:hypothetical protein